MLNISGFYKQKRSVKKIVTSLIKDPEMKSEEWCIQIMRKRVARINMRVYFDSLTEEISFHSHIYNFPDTHLH